VRFQSDRRVVQRTADIFNLTTVQASCRIGSPVYWIILTWNRPTEEGHSNVNTAILLEYEQLSAQECAVYWQCS